MSNADILILCAAERASIQGPQRNCPARTWHRDVRFGLHS